MRFDHFTLNVINDAVSATCVHVAFSVTLFSVQFNVLLLRLFERFMRFKNYVLNAVLNLFGDIMILTLGIRRIFVDVIVIVVTVVLHVVVIVSDVIHVVGIRTCDKRFR